MPRIFISYRRSDSRKFTRKLYDALSRQFSGQGDHVFRDLDNMPFGGDFRTHIQTYICQCDSLLAVIGDKWLDAKKEERRRLDDDKDPVRTEIGVALARQVRVIPVLVGNAEVPGLNSLPADLHKLAYANAADFREGRDFEASLDRLTSELREVRSIPLVRRFRKVFLSYSLKDLDLAERVESVLPVTGDIVLLDAVSLRSGERWEDRLEELIKEADIFVLLWSENAAKSKYVRREWETALSLQRSDDFICPVLCVDRGAEVPTWASHLYFRPLSDKF